jgi:PilZ domain
MVNLPLSVTRNHRFTLNAYILFGKDGEQSMTELNTTTANNILTYEDAAQEDRSAPRIKLRIPAQMRPSGFTGFSVIVKDLSLSGFAAEALTGMKAGTRVFLTLPGLGGLQAEIAWNDGTMVGCAFSELLNPAVLESILSRFSIAD